MSFESWLEVEVASCLTTLMPECCTFLQVTTLTDYKSSRGRTGKPRKVTKLVQIVDKATRNFIAVGEEIANENPEFQVTQCYKVGGEGRLQVEIYFCRYRLVLAFIMGSGVIRS